MMSRMHHSNMVHAGDHRSCSMSEPQDKQEMPSDVAGDNPPAVETTAGDDAKDSDGGRDLSKANPLNQAAKGAAPGRYLYCKLNLIYSNIIQLRAHINLQCECDVRLQFICLLRHGQVYREPSAHAPARQRTPCLRASTSPSTSAPCKWTSLEPLIADNDICMHAQL
jgi:hypothetical protein